MANWTRSSPGWFVEAEHMTLTEFAEHCERISPMRAKSGRPVRTRFIDHVAKSNRLRVAGRDVPFLTRDVRRLRRYPRLLKSVSRRKRWFSRSDVTEEIDELLDARAARKWSACSTCPDRANQHSCSLSTQIFAKASGEITAIRNRMAQSRQERCEERCLLRSQRNRLCAAHTTPRSKMARNLTDRISICRPRDRQLVCGSKASVFVRN